MDVWEPEDAFRRFGEVLVPLMQEAGSAASRRSALYNVKVELRSSLDRGCRSKEGGTARCSSARRPRRRKGDSPACRRGDRGNPERLVRASHWYAHEMVRFLRSALAWLDGYLMLAGRNCCVGRTQLGVRRSIDRRTKCEKS